MKISKSSMEKSINKSGYLFLLPALLIVFIVFIIPLITSLYLSFTKWNYMEAGSTPKFAGLQNYINNLTNPGDVNSFKITFIFVFITVALELIIGLSIALLLNRKFKGLNIFRTLIILPMMVSEVVAALCWRYMLQSDFGIINYLLVKIGIGAQVWGGGKYAFSTIVVMELWQQTPFAILIILAALQSISIDVLEAADIDGASYFQKLFRVVLPNIKPQILIVLIFRTMFAMRVFTQPYVLTGGGPADKTLVLGINIYRKAFRYYDMGGANSLSWILVVTSMLIIIAYILLLNKEEYQK